MSNPNISYVQYFIPTDGDSEEHPNVFVVRRPPRGLTLGDIESAFPLPGKYLFRAKMAAGKTHGAWELSRRAARRAHSVPGRGAAVLVRTLLTTFPLSPPHSFLRPVWMDLGAAEDLVPQFVNKFTLKVARLSMGAAGVSATAPVAAAPVARAASTASAAAVTAGPRATSVAPAPAPSPTPAPVHVPSPAAEDLLGLSTGSAQAPAGAARGASASANAGSGSAHGLADVFGAPSRAPAAAAPAARGAPLVAHTQSYVDPFAAKPAAAQTSTRGGAAPATAKAPASILEGDIFSM